LLIADKAASLFKTTFISLKHKNFRYFWIGQGISLTGTWMQRTAQLWLVYTITKSPFLVGLLGVCQFMPMLLYIICRGVYRPVPEKEYLASHSIAFYASGNHFNDTDLYGCY
jgi:hypothetical protein